MQIFHCLHIRALCCRGRVSRPDQSSLSICEQKKLQLLVCANISLSAHTGITTVGEGFPLPSRRRLPGLLRNPANPSRTIVFMDIRAKNASVNLFCASPFSLPLRGRGTATRWKEFIKKLLQLRLRRASFLFWKALTGERKPYKKKTELKYRLCFSFGNVPPYPPHNSSVGGIK